MGVIKRNENLFTIKTSVSEETLYIPSGDEEDTNHIWLNTDTTITQPPRIPRQRPSPIGPCTLNLKNHSGKKKFRRYHNVAQLMTLAEKDELDEVTIEDFIVNSKSGFTCLLQDEQSLKKWDEFVSCSEERQRELLEVNERKKKEWSRPPIINRALRSLLRKKNLPMGMLDYLEQELYTFFSVDPTKTYVSPVLNSFQRLLLHSVSNYHCLASLSFVSRPENVKLVRVKNPKKEFPSQPLRLVQYLESNYSNC